MEREQELSVARDEPTVDARLDAPGHGLALKLPDARPYRVRAA